MGLNQMVREMGDGQELPYQMAWDLIDHEAAEARRQGRPGPRHATSLPTQDELRTKVERVFGIA